MKIIEERELRAAVGPADALAAAERAFRALAEQHVVQPAPLGLEIADVRGEVHVKGAYLKGSPIFALKVATGFYDNARRNLPTGAGLFLVFDATTGFPLALLRDNAYLTDLRTGAAGALLFALFRPKQAGGVWLIALLASLGVAAIWWQGKMFDYHWLILIPLLAPLAGFALDEVSERAHECVVWRPSATPACSSGRHRAPRR